MQHIVDITHYTYEEKRSKFICYLLPYSSFDTTLSHLKQKHPKARHFVYAYRYLNEFDQIVENQSDDGEPKNSSEKPSLNVLRGKNLINTAIITVRYFGGIKLGVGGLVRAYTKSVVLVCESVDLLPYIKTKILLYRCSYSNLAKVEYVIKDHGALCEKEFCNDSVLCKIEVAEETYDILEKKLRGR